MFFSLYINIGCTDLARSSLLPSFIACFLRWLLTRLTMTSTRNTTLIYRERTTWKAFYASLLPFIACYISDQSKLFLSPDWELKTVFVWSLTDFLAFSFTCVFQCISLQEILESHKSQGYKYNHCNYIPGSMSTLWFHVYNNSAQHTSMMANIGATKVHIACWPLPDANQQLWGKTEPCITWYTDINHMKMVIEVTWHWTH